MNLIFLLKKLIFIDKKHLLIFHGVSISLELYNPTYLKSWST